MRWLSGTAPNPYAFDLTTAHRFDPTADNRRIHQAAFASKRPRTIRSHVRPDNNRSPAGETEVVIVYDNTAVTRTLLEYPGIPGMPRATRAVPWRAGTTHDAIRYGGRTNHERHIRQLK